jgi:hypothetical protein
VLEPPTMPPVAVTTLDPRAACHACGRALPPDSAVCGACGAANGEANRCPHCHAVADVEPHAALGFRCLVCGGPRVALNISGVTPSSPTIAALAAAAKRHTEQLMFTSGGLVLSAMGVLALVIATVVVLAAAPGVVPTVAAYLGALVPAVAGAFALARGGAARKLRDESLHAARVGALGDVQAVTGVLDAQRVAEIMRLTPERAELLLAEASVASLLDQAPPPRVRVPAAATTEPGAMPLDDVEPELHRPATRAARGDTEV